MLQMRRSGALSRPRLKIGWPERVINNAAIVPMVWPSEVEEYNRVLSINVTGSNSGANMAFALSTRWPAVKAARSSICLPLWGWPAQLPWPPITLQRCCSPADQIGCGRVRHAGRYRCNSIHPGIVESEMGSLFHEQLVSLGVVPDMETSEAGFLAGVPWVRPPA